MPTISKLVSRAERSMPPAIDVRVDGEVGSAQGTSPSSPPPIRMRLATNEEQAGRDVVAPGYRRHALAWLLCFIEQPALLLRHCNCRWGPASSGGYIALPPTKFRSFLRFAPEAGP